ncbi:MAG TPA: hypothetical protein VMW74_02705 [Nitrosopumilaceae archaeon]|nr:hypothetical protein [Nitrosopumilaceae archaeon]
MTQAEIDALRADWLKNRFSEKYRNLEMNYPNHPMKPEYVVLDPTLQEDTIFERCILP